LEDAQNGAFNSERTLQLEGSGREWR